MKQERLATDRLIGSVLLGRYRIVRELAKGGMGVVYLARAEGAVGFVKPVVVKLVLPEHAEDDRFVGMFAREARILAQLRHPSVVDVLEFGEEDDAYVLVLEYVRGHHLGQWMRYLYLKGRSAPPEILIQIVIDVLDALHHAHNQKHPDGTPMQIVHRDVSPSNVLLDEDGRARLLDFGVARMRGGAHDYKTQVKGFMGKLPYTAPEIFAGNEATPQSDLYACAVVLHEVLLGRNVFRTESQAATLHTVMTHIPEALEPTRPLPQGFDAVLGKALAKNPMQRYFSAREFASALRKLQREQESDIRAQLATLLKVDFGREIADMLKIESLADRDEAWRKLSLRPPQPGSAEPVPERTATRSRRNTLRGAIPAPSFPEAPPPSDATVANSPRILQAGLRTDAPPRHSVPQPPAQPQAEFQPPPAALAEPVRPLPPPIAMPPAAEARRAASPPIVEITAPVVRAPASNRLLIFALAVTALIAIAAIVVALQDRAPAAAPDTPNIRVVELDNSESEKPVPVEPATAAVEPAPERQADAEPTQPSRGERAGQAPKRPRAPDPRDLTRAFRKQQPKIEGCFKQHAVGLQGQPRMQLEFDLDAKGALTHVQVMPESLSSTPLGQCVTRVARSTAFPAQGESVSFAIPVTASVGP
jgi:serine/threonine protein kinase